MTTSEHERDDGRRAGDEEVASEGKEGQDGDLRGLLSSVGAVPLAMGVGALGLPLLMIVLFARVRETVEEFLTAQGAMGPLIFAAGVGVVTGLALSPTWLLAGFAGYLFGSLAGSAAAIGGITLGACIGYAICRLIAGPSVRRAIKQTPRFEIIRRAITDRGLGDEILAIGLIRFPPNSPFAATNFAMGVVGAKFLPFVIATPLGMAPRTILAAFLGAGVRAAGEALGERGPERPGWLMPLGIVLAVVVFFGVYKLFSKWVEAAMPEELRSVHGRVSK